MKYNDAVFWVCVGLVLANVVMIFIALQIPGARDLAKQHFLSGGLCAVGAAAAYIRSKRNR